MPLCACLCWQGPERKAAILRVAMQQLLECLEKCHAVGERQPAAGGLLVQLVLAVQLVACGSCSCWWLVVQLVACGGC